jgi:hypothetical protein
VLAEALRQIADARLEGARLLGVALAQGLELLAVAVLGLEHRLRRAQLHRDQGVRAVLGGQHRDQLLVVVLGEGGEHRLDLSLHGVGALVVELPGDLLGDLGAGLLDGLAERVAELADPLLEDPLHVVDVRRGALGVDHTRADLDRLRNRLGRGRARLGPLADDLGGALVVDGERLDHDPVAERAHGASLLERELVELVSARSFHLQWVLEGSRAPGHLSDNCNRAFRGRDRIHTRMRAEAQPLRTCKLLPRPKPRSASSSSPSSGSSCSTRAPIT